MRAEGARLKPAVRLRRFRALLLLALAPLSAANAGEPSGAAVLDAFGKIAFGTEFAADADPRLQKWLRPIRWRRYEYMPLTDAESAFLQRHMERLKRLTGHDIAEARSRAETNFAIVFVREDRYADMIERELAAERRHLLERHARTTCLGLLRNDRATFEIETAVVIIPLDRARGRGLATACIAEETTQGLGLPNDADLAGTLFNDRGDARDLTPLDELLVRLLYDPRLKPGLRRGEALAIARAVLPKLRTR